MIYYVSTPTGERCLAACREHGYREMACPVRTLHGRVVRRSVSLHLDRYALDNGAWIYHIAKEPLDFEPFIEAVQKIGQGADFVVAPDMVGGGLESLKMSVAWTQHLLERARMVLVPVQDGMRSQDLASVVGERVGIFVGGTTAWKWSTLQRWTALARQTGCYLHVGRVNTVRRADLCADLGVDSADGSTVARFSTTAWRMRDATDPDRSSQPHLPFDEETPS